MTEQMHLLKVEALAEWFQDQVLAWAKIKGRHDFPWQAPHTPYKTWISEIMLQQTQAARVVDFFIPFMKQFPDIESLAMGREDEVFHLWSGLGYYTRAHNLWRTAQIVHREHQSQLPETLPELMALPGIGRSTAGAILSLGHGLPGQILDGNVRRVLGRFAMVQGKPQSRTMEENYWQIVARVTPNLAIQDRHFNQAMMDLGASVCTIRNPSCDQCPLAAACKSALHDKVDEYPVTLAQYKRTLNTVIPARRHVSRYFLFLNRDQEILLQKRPPQGIWQQLWCPIEFESKTALLKYLVNHDIKEAQVTMLPGVFHRFSHYDLTMNPVHAKIERSEITPMTHEPQQFLWYNMAKPQGVGLPAPVARILSELFHTKTTVTAD